MVQGSFVTVFIFHLPVAQALDKDVVSILQDTYFFTSDVAQDTYESMLHHRFHSDNIKNEWFELTDEQAMSFIDECKKCENIINALKDNPFF